MMKSKLVLVVVLLMGLSTVNAGQDPVLMTIEQDSIFLSDFENIYKKNNNVQQGIEEKSLDEYLTLFVNFKLKVKEATELGMDTTEAFINELAGYRKQLAQPYLIDQAVNEQLVVEAYERLQSDVKASHILIKLDPAATPTDTLKAWNQIQAIKKRALQGEDFGELAMTLSQDPSAKQNKGDLGYFTAFQMVYEFENAAFSTEPGKITDPVRTRFGYHILKVEDKRPARGQIRVAHIMVKTMTSFTEEQHAEARAKIDEIHAKIVAGGDFVELAKDFSDDKNSGRKGGTLPWFGTGRMVKEFEDVAFALEANGDVSAPVQTKFGWHIIKRLDKKELESFEDKKSELKSKVNRDARGGKSRASLLAAIKKDYGYQLNLSAKEAFYTLLDDSYFSGKWTVPANKSLTKELFKLTDDKYSGNSQTYTQRDFANYLEKQSKRRQAVAIEQLVNELFDAFVEESCIAFEDQLLAAKHKEFRALMQEYRDGILLFELMDKKVWTKAVQDTAGLADFHAQNIEKFMWGKRVKANVFSCASQDVANAVRKQVLKREKKGETNADIIKRANETSALNLRFETGTFQQYDNESVDKVDWVTGVSETFKAGDRVTFIEIISVMDPAPKNLKECKGQATAEYQTYLEEQWIAELRAKYKVHVDMQVLTQLD